MYTVYKHTNKVNNKIYIGITGRKVNERWREGEGYKPKNKNQNAYFYNAISKYGWDKFEHEILYSDLTKKQAEIKEMELISEYKSNERSFGYNIESGGKSTGRLSDETKKKISESWNYNKEERCKNISKGKKGVPFSEEHKQNLSNAKKGRKALNRKPVSQYDLNMNFIKRWESLEDVQQELNICKANICRAIKYDRTAGGYKWTY